MFKLTILTTTLLATSAFAGERIVSSGKSYKGTAVQECFRAQELQLDVFGQYSDGNGSDHAGPIRDHGWGGGLGLNYFLTMNLGIGVDAAWLDARQNSSLH